MKKISFLFIITLLPLMSSAQTLIDGVYYNLIAKAKLAEVTLGDTKYTGSVTIPESFTYNGVTYSVTSIGDYAFSGCSGLTSVTIPNSVTSIGSWAFSDCSKLTTINIPNSVTSIGSYAFNGCSGLTSVTIGNSVTSIGDGAFYDCFGLTTVTIPNSVTSIGRLAFSGCSGLTKVTLNSNAIASKSYSSSSTLGSIFGSQVKEFILGNEVTAIGSYAFYNCSNVTSVTIGDSVTSIGDYAFYNCSSLTSVNIPNSVTSIGSGAFYGCSGLTSVTISNSVKNIGSLAFSGCSGLTSIEIPNSVTSIGDYAFEYCRGLTSVTIPNSVTSIGNYAFYYCKSLKSVKSDISVPFTFGSNAFSNISSNCVLVVPSGTKDAYITKGWTTSVFKGGIKEFLPVVDGIYYYFNSNNKQVTVTAGENKYSGNVTIPSSVTYNVETYSVTSIGEDAFHGCSGLTSIAIPNSVTSIGNEAFYYCSSLKSVKSDISVPFTFGSNAFSNISSNCVLVVPFGTKDAYITKGWTTSVFKGGIKEMTYVVDGIYYGFNSNNKQATVIAGENKYSGNVIIPSSVTYNGETYSVTSIGEDAFRGCSSLTEVTIPNSVTSIGSHAFYGCSGLTKVTLNSNAIASSESYSPSSTLGSIFGGQVKEYILGDDVTSIGSYAFYDCYRLTSVTIGNSVTSIGYCAFYKCYGLTSIAIPNSVTSIEEDAFYHCYGLTSVTIGNSVTSIAYNAFDGCYGLTKVTLNSNAIASKSYSSSSTLGSIFGSQVKEYVLGDDVTSIGSYAFYNCSYVTSIIIPDNVTSVGDYAFDGTAWYNNSPDGLFYAGKVAYKYKGTMPENTSVVIKEGIVNLNDNLFSGCSGLTSVTIPNSVTSIGENAFLNCSSLTKVTLNSNAIASKSYSYDSTLGSIFGNQVNEYVLGDDVTSIGNYAFQSCSGLTSVTIGNSVTSIGNSAFQYCSKLTSVTIGNSVTSIGEKAFYHCSGLTSVTIGNSVTSIGEQAFLSCSGLTSITIPNSVTYIGMEAFYYCSSLKSVKSDISVPFTFGSNAFRNISSNCVLAVPYGTKDAYIAKGWTTSVFKGGIKEIMPVVDGIYYGFNSNNKQAIVIAGENKYSGNVIIPSSVTYNGGTYSVTSIGNSAFQYCSKLTSVTIGNSVTSIGSGAFWLCSGLTSVTIPNSVTNIGSGAFYKCSKLTSITIPNSVTSIGDNAFYGVDLPTVISLIENPFAISGKTSDYSPFSQNTFNNATLYVPVGTIEKYKATEGWKDFANIVELPEPTLRGDANGDGKVDMNDAIFVTNIILGTENASEAADVNKDGEINMPDVMFIINYIKNGKFPDEGNIDDSNDDDVTPPTQVSYKLIYLVDGVEYKKYEIVEGATITPEPAPTKDGYTFSGWSSISATMPAHDVTITGIFTQNKDDSNINYVDLGLPSGLLWATCNIGAKKPEEYGIYFDWNNNPVQESWDAVWRTPTKSERDELVKYCTYSVDTVNGIKGARYTGVNGKSIFFPFAGYKQGSGGPYQVGVGGQYWTCTKYSEREYWILATNNATQTDDNGYYWPMTRFGLPVRAVASQIPVSNPSW